MTLKNRHVKLEKGKEKGRRKIGKSRLIQEFARTAINQTFWSFAGLAPENGISAQEQRDNVLAKDPSFIPKLKAW